MCWCLPDPFGDQRRLELIRVAWPMGFLFINGQDFIIL